MGNKVFFWKSNLSEFHNWPFFFDFSSCICSSFYYFCFILVYSFGSIFYWLFNSNSIWNCFRFICFLSSILYWCSYGNSDSKTGFFLEFIWIYKKSGNGVAGIISIFLRIITKLSLSSNDSGKTAFKFQFRLKTKFLFSTFFIYI